MNWMTDVSFFIEYSVKITVITDGYINEQK